MYGVRRCIYINHQTVVLFLIANYVSLLVNVNCDARGIEMSIGSCCIAFSSRLNRTTGSGVMMCAMYEIGVLEGPYVGDYVQVYSSTIIKDRSDVRIASDQIR